MNTIQDGPSSPDGRVGTAMSRQPARGYRWRLIAALWVIVACAAALPSIGASVVNAHMAEALHFDRTIIGTGFGLFILMLGVPGPIVAVGISRFGFKRVIITGCLLLSSGALAMATVVTREWQFPLVFGLLVGGGVACAGVLPAQAAVAQWFPDRRALAVSIVLSAIDIGGIAAAPSLEKVISLNGGEWRTGWYAMFAMALLALIVSTLALRGDRPALDGVVTQPFASSQGAREAAGRLWTFREALGVRAFWLIMIYACVVGFDWMLMMAHGVVHLRDCGYSSSAAALTVAIMISASLVGNVAAGILGDRISTQRIGAVAIGLVTVGLVAAVHPRGVAGLWMFAIPVGFGYGASQVCLMALLAKYFGSGVFPQLLGLLLAVGTLAGALLVGAAGVVFDRVGSYSPVFILCISLSAIATAAVFAASPPGIREGGKRSALKAPKAHTN